MSTHMYIYIYVHINHSRYLVGCKFDIDIDNFDIDNFVVEFVESVDSVDSVDAHSFVPFFTRSFIHSFFRIVACNL